MKAVLLVVFLMPWVDADEGQMREDCDEALASARTGLDDAVARFEKVAKYLTAAIRGECLADGGSCDECCHGITGRCQKYSGLYYDEAYMNYISLTDEDDCVLVEGTHNEIHVTFPRLKPPRLFFSSAWRIGIRRRRRDCRQGRLQLAPRQHLPRPSRIAAVVASSARAARRSCRRFAHA